jgi:hypothetical protein
MMKNVSVCNMPYTAVTSAEKAKARRLERNGRARVTREIDTHILKVRGKPRLYVREVYYVEPIIQ